MAKKKPRAKVVVGEPEILPGVEVGEPTILTQEEEPIGVEVGTPTIYQNGVGEPQVLPPEEDPQMTMLDRMLEAKRNQEYYERTNSLGSLAKGAWQGVKNLYSGGNWFDSERERTMRMERAADRRAMLQLIKAPNREQAPDPFASGEPYPVDTTYKPRFITKK